MNIPERCKDCIFLKDIELTRNDNFGCMLGHSLSTALGCPNQEKINKYK